MTNIELSSQTKEFLKGEVIASSDLDSQTVEVAFLVGNPTTDTDWLTAEWVGDVGATRSWRVLLSPGDLEVGTYKVWFRVTDASESTVRRHADKLKIV